MSPSAVYLIGILSAVGDLTTVGIHVSDEQTIWLSKDIARQIENELQYPGQTKVTVIRETRATEFAR